MISSADSVWLLGRLVIEAHKGMRVTLESHQRIEAVVLSNALHDHWCVKNILKGFRPSEARIAPKQQEQLGIEPTFNRLTYFEIQEALRTRSVLTGVLVVDDLSDAEAEELAIMLDPELDPRARAKAIDPHMALKADGFRVVGTQLGEPTGSAVEARRTLRPVFAAGIPGRSTPLWHVSSIKEENYVRNFFKSVAAMGDSNRLVEEFEENVEVLLEHLEETNWLEPCRHLIDARLVPPLLRVARAGTDQLLASLCRIASWIP